MDSKKEPKILAYIQASRKKREKDLKNIEAGVKFYESLRKENVK